MRKWNEGDLTVNGVRLHYYRLGNQDSPPLVLQHGFSDNGLCYLTLAGDLEGEYDIVLPDARGHGRSAHLERGERRDATADLAGLIRGLGLEHPVVGGHSMGARTAAQLGARYPDLSRALILEDPPWRLADTAEARPPVMGENSPRAEWIRSLADLPLEQVIERHRAEHPTWSDLVVHRWSEGKQQLDPNFFTSPDVGQMDWQEVVSAITCPTLLITADPDKGGIVTPEVARMVRERNDLISVVHIPGVGHHVRFEDYGTYADAVRAFLRQVAQG